ncbi:unnamed protein product [Linum trigynum]|uniref:Uncharacterized protein n=1 Tax=Linum trigynum TaxID=586398 RepID=A0AAV2F9Q8_9ROSI
MASYAAGKKAERWQQKNGGRSRSCQAQFPLLLALQALARLSIATLREGGGAAAVAEEEQGRRWMNHRRRRSETKARRDMGWDEDGVGQSGVYFRV